MIKSIIIQRLITSIIAIFIITSLAFIAPRMLPGNPFQQYQLLHDKSLDHVKSYYHFDKSITEQYIHYMKNMMTLNFGKSIKYHDENVHDIIINSLPYSIWLGSIAFIISMIFAIPFGIIMGYYHLHRFGKLMNIINTIFLAIPIVGLSFILIIVFSIKYNILPNNGWNNGSIYDLSLPIIVLIFLNMPYIAKITRISVIDIMHRPYIRYAIIKGFSDIHIMIFYILRPASLIIITTAIPCFFAMITGNVIVENIFGLPGIGYYAVNAVFTRDYPLIAGCIFIISILYIIALFILDILYVILDPRIRDQQSKF